MSVPDLGHLYVSLCVCVCVCMYAYVHVHVCLYTFARCRNILAIQQNLTNITLTRETDLDRARHFYELLYLSPDVSAVVWCVPCVLWGIKCVVCRADSQCFSHTCLYVPRVYAQVTVVSAFFYNLPLICYLLLYIPDKTLDRAYTKLLRVVKNVTWRQRITNEMLYAGLPWTLTTIRERRLWFSSYCWRSKNEVVSDLVLWELKHGKRSVRGQARTFVDLLEADTDVPRHCLLAAMDDRVGWRKRAVGRGVEGGGGGGWGGDRLRST